jgi:hypothetical protein
VVSLKGLAEAVLDWDDACRACGSSDIVEFRDHRGRSLEHLYQQMLTRARAVGAVVEPTDVKDALHAVGRRSHEEVRMTFLAAIHNLLERGDTAAALHNIVESIAGRFAIRDLRDALYDLIAAMPPPEVEKAN